MSFPAYPSYQDSGIEWLAEVPSHWTVVQTKREFRRLKVVNTGMICEDRLALTMKGVVPRDLDDLDGLQSNDYEGYQIFEAGDLAFKLIDLQNVKTSRVGMVPSRGIMSPAYIRLEPANPDIARFGFWYFMALYWTQVFNNLGGGVRQTLGPEDLLTVPFPLPPRDEQVAIATFLDRETTKIDALIEEQRRLIALLKEKRQGVISRAVTKGLDSHAPMKDSGIEWLGEVPTHWEVKRLRFICHIGTGDADTADAVEDGLYPFFVRSPVIERIGDFSHDCEAVLTAGDGAGVGKVYHYFTGKFRAHQRVYIFSRFSGVLGRFFYAYMSEMFAKAVLEGTAKSTVESLRRPMIADFWMTVPSDAEQAEIMGHIEAASARIDALSNEADAAIRLLNERRAALISAAVTGKIDVRASAKVLPFPIDRTRARGLVATEIIERSAGQPTFGRVKFQKVAFLAEGHVGISELAGCYTRAAAGPFDSVLIEDMERGAHSIAGITVDQAGGTGSTVSYRLGQQRGAHRQELADWLGTDRSAKLGKLIADFAGLTTNQAEAVATLYGVWNDALSEGTSPSDDEIISGLLNDWHPEKRDKFRASELSEWLGWMRRHGIVPTGSGPTTMTGRLFV